MEATGEVEYTAEQAEGRRSGVVGMKQM